MPGTISGTRPSTIQVILIPSIITLAITILRLVGELQQWPKPWFGGGGAIVGISWLPFIFGPYFALKLAGMGDGPASNGKAIGLSLAGLPVVVLGGFAVFEGLTHGNIVIAAMGFLIFFAASFLPRAGWLALGNTLLAYGFAARIPVVIVMFIATRAGWTTHYSLAGPGPFSEAPLERFIALALLPQMLLWTGFTAVIGAILGTIVQAIAGRGKAAAHATA